MSPTTAPGRAGATPAAILSRGVKDLLLAGIRLAADHHRPGEIELVAVERAERVDAHDVAGLELPERVGGGRMGCGQRVRGGAG
jgi:hypothetical protein